MSCVEAFHCAMFNECSLSGFCIRLVNGVYKCVCLATFVSPNLIAPFLPFFTTMSPVTDKGFSTGCMILVILFFLLLVAYIGFVLVAKWWHGEGETWLWAIVLPFVRLGVLLKWIYHLLPFVKSETVVKKKRQSDNDNEEKSSSKKKEGVNVVIELSKM